MVKLVTSGVRRLGLASGTTGMSCELTPAGRVIEVVLMSGSSVKRGT